MSSDKTVGGLLTEIADILREEVNVQKYKLEMMPVAIRELGANNFRLGKEEGIQQGYDIGFLDGQASKPFEVHQITVASDLTSGENTLLANNAFIKENYNKPGFSIQLISLTANTTGPAVGYAYNGNRQFQNNVCGVMIVLSSSNGNNYRATTGNCYTVSYSNVPYVDNEGNVKMQNSSTNGTLKAGDYLIILSVAEVAE